MRVRKKLGKKSGIFVTFLTCKVLTHPLNKVVLEHPFNELVEQVQSDELVDIGVGKVFCERLEVVSSGVTNHTD